MQRFLDTGGGFATTVGKSNQENRTLLPRSCFSSRTRFPRTGLEVPALAVVLVFVILGSLTPFQLDFQLNGWLGLSDGPLFWPKTNPVDAAVNVVVYAFVGAGLFALLRNRFEVPGAAVLTILCSVSLSATLETTQLIIKGRYASLWDVCFNAIGAVVGAVLVGLFYRKIVRYLWGLRQHFRRNPVSATSTVVVLGLVLVATAPFNFVTSARGLSASMQGAQIPTAAAVAAGRFVPGFDGFDLSLSALVPGDFVWAVAFALLGYVSVLGNRNSASSNPGAFVAAIGSGWLLAIVIEVMKLFAQAHVFALVDVVVHGAAFSAGAIVAVLHLRSQFSPSNRPASMSITSGILAFVVLGQMLVILAPDLLASGGGDAHAYAFAQKDWVPLAALFAKPFTDAAAELVEIWFMYTLLIAPLFVWFLRLTPRFAAPVSIGTAMLVAAAAGLHHVDDGAAGFVTRVMVAAVAACWTVRLTQFFCEPNTAPMPKVARIR